MKWIGSVRDAVGRLVDAWTGFWFAPEDPLSLGVLRVLVGGMMLYSHLVWGINLEGFFGPDGWQSTEAVQEFFAEDWLPSFWWYVPVEQLRLVHILCLIPLLMFAVGLWTPMTSVLALVITISNSNRAPLANYGLDQIMSVLGLYLVIGGSGSRVSLDAWRRRRRFERRLDRDYHSVWQPPRTSRARLGTRLIQIHFCIIYFFAGMSKLQGDAWWNGEAVWMAFANKEYQSIDMTWLARYPWVFQLATHATIYWELSFPFLIWNRTLRPYVLLLGIGMHAGIGLCMGMITFGSIMIFGYLGFVPPETMQWALDRLARRPASPKPLLLPDDLSSGRVSSAADSPDDVVDVMSLSFDIAHDGETEADAAPSADNVSKEARGLADARAPVTKLTADNDNSSNTPPKDVPSTREPTLPVAPSRPIAVTHSPRVPDVADNPSPPSVAVCDPSGKHRPFAHYLSNHDYRPFLSGSPDRLWRHVEQYNLRGAILFVDRLGTKEFALLLGDLTLFPIADLPILIASQRESRRQRADALNLPNLKTIAIPSAFRQLRTALEAVLALPETANPTNGVHPPSINGHDPPPKPAQPIESPADASQETSP